MLADDTTRPYISSSPSNGFICKSPFTERFKVDDNDAWGDVHYYNYKDNGTDISKFRKPRFVSGKYYLLFFIIILSYLLNPLILLVFVSIIGEEDRIAFMFLILTV